MLWGLEAETETLALWSQNQEWDFGLMKSEDYFAVEKPALSFIPFWCHLNQVVVGKKAIKRMLFIVTLEHSISYYSFTCINCILQIEFTMHVKTVWMWCCLDDATVGHKVWWDRARIWPAPRCSQHNHVCRPESTICVNVRWQKPPSLGMVNCNLLINLMSLLFDGWFCALIGATFVRFSGTADYCNRL